MLIRAARTSHVVTSGVSVLLLLPAAAMAQGTARSLDIDASIVSAGMGGASTAVYWTAEPNAWANPALLGYCVGMHWVWGHTNLLPEISNDITFDTNQLTLGGGGIGFESSGKPIDGLGGTRLSYGSSAGTDPSGNPTGTFDAYEDVDAQAVGVSLSQLTSSLLALRGTKLPSLVRHFDVAGGYTSKHAVVAIAPNQPGGVASTDLHDHGLLFRAGADASDLGWKDVPGLAFDVSYGYAVLNDDEVLFTFGTTSAPPSRMTRKGYSARVGVDRAPTPGGSATGFQRLMVSGLKPLFAVGYANDNEHVEAAGQGGGFDVDHWGVDLTVLNLVSIRSGHVTDQLGGINGGTFGFGVALPIGDVAAVRYDCAAYPQAVDSGLKSTKRNALSFSLNPVALWHATR